MAQDRAAHVAASPYAALRARNFQLFFAGNFTGIAGAEMQTVAVGWELYERTGSTFALGLVGLVQIVPIVLLALVAGHFADKYSRRKILMFAQTTNALASCGLVAASFLSADAKSIYACLFLSGVARAFSAPARQALLPQIVPRDVFQNAVTWNTGGFQLASIIGPALGGAVIALAHQSRYVYLLNACAALAFVLVVSRIRPLIQTATVTTQQRDNQSNAQARDRLAANNASGEIGEADQAVRLERTDQVDRSNQIDKSDALDAPAFTLNRLADDDLAPSETHVGVVKQRATAAPMRARRWTELVAGAVFIYRTPIIFAALALDLFAVLLGGAVALLPVYAKDILQVGAGGLGWLSAAPAIGAVLMTFLAAHLPPFKRAGATMLWAVAGFGVATIIFGLSRSFPLSLIALFALGACDQISVIIRSTLVQLSTPDAMRGRVSAINSVFIGTSNELGRFESGAVAAAFNPVFAVASGGVGTLVVVALVAWLVPPLRRYGELGKRENRI